MKTNIKKKTLTINNKELILKEGWGDVAANMATDGSWTKIAKVALKGALALAKGVWNTGLKLPARLISAMWNNKSISDVMADWERSDRKIKDEQRKIIQSTGVEDTVDAFIGICNPAALALDKWNGYHNEEAAKTVGMYGTKFWNNTMGKVSSDLIIDEEEASDVIRSKISYSNFVLSVAKRGINVKVSSQDYIESYDEFKKKSKRTFASYIEPTNQISKTSTNFKEFIKFLNEMSLSKNKFNNVTYSGKNFAQYVSEVIGETQYKNLKKKLFDAILSKKLSTTEASGIIISEGLSSSITDIIRFIKGADRLNKEFKKYSTVSSEESSSEESSSEESSSEESSSEESSKKEGIVEKYSSTKKLVVSNNKIFQKYILENKEIKKEKVKYIKRGTTFYLDHITFLIQIRFLIVLKMSMLKSAYIYSLYKDFADNIESKNYAVSENSDTSSIKTNFNTLRALLDNILLYFNDFKKEKKLFPPQDSTLYVLEKEFKKNGLDESKIIKELNSSINLENEELSEKLLDTFASALNKDKEALKDSLENDDLKNVYKLLSAASFYKEMIDNTEINESINKQIIDANNIFNLIQKISKHTNAILNKESFKEVFSLLKGTINTDECFKVIKNLDLEFNENTKSINNFKAVFDTKKIEPILREKEKELEEVLSISKETNPGEINSDQSTEEGLSYILDKNKYTDTAIIDLASVDEERN